MSSYAMLENSYVTNFIVSHNKEETEAALNVTLVEYIGAECGLGYFWDGEKFIAPTTENKSN